MKSLLECFSNVLRLRLIHYVSLQALCTWYLSWSCSSQFRDERGTHWREGENSSTWRFDCTCFVCHHLRNRSSDSKTLGLSRRKHYVHNCHCSCISYHVPVLDWLSCSLWRRYSKHSHAGMLSVQFKCTFEHKVIFKLLLDVSIIRFHLNKLRSFGCADLFCHCRCQWKCAQRDQDSTGFVLLQFSSNCGPSGYYNWSREVVQVWDAWNFAGIKCKRWWPYNSRRYGHSQGVEDFAGSFHSSWHFWYRHCNIFGDRYWPHSVE